eukprot:jgi/Mesvir1/26403/Mv16093-RA.1
MLRNGVQKATSSVRSALRPRTQVAGEAAGAAKNTPGKGTPTGYADDLADGVADSKNFTVMGTPVANAAGAAAKKSSLAGSLAKNVGMSAVSFGVFAALGNLFGSDSSKVGAAQDTWTDDWTGTPEDATAAGLPVFGTAKKPKDEDGYSPLVSVIVFVAILALILAVALTWRRPERSAEDERFLTDPSTHRRSRYIPSLRELAINAIPEGPEQDAAWHLASHGEFPADEM